jgi:phosphoribosylformimino-5-aminoimidazole carboxamide ribonucleotide (ProFAR) isomerase
MARFVSTFGQGVTSVGIHLDTGGLQIGGGINDQNAKEWLDAGASKVRGYQASKP